MSKRDLVDRSNRWLFGAMLVFGITGLLASFILSIDEIHLLKQPDATLSCSINLVLNCASVMKTWQASVFGFPNMLIGLMAYPVVITTAVVALAGGKLPRWYWRAAHICYGLGAVFAYWLFFNSLYVIQVLCPWCLIVTFSTTILFATITHYMIRDNIYGLPDRAYKKMLYYQGKDLGKLAVASWIVLMIVLVILKFGEGLFA